MSGSKTSPLILVVEDEEPLAELLGYNLEKAGFRTVISSTGEDALQRVQTQQPDLAIVDWMLPERSGIDICRSIRAQVDNQKLPIIMLTARGEESDRVLGLEAGADDYVVKPYSPREMIARINALLRRSEVLSTASQSEYADIRIDYDTRKVTRAGSQLHLSPTCFRLLATLMEHPGYVYSRERLLGRVWGSDVFVQERTVDVHVRRLRKELNARGGRDLIRTVRSVGYSIDKQV